MATATQSRSANRSASFRDLTDELIERFPPLPVVVESQDGKRTVLVPDPRVEFVRAFLARNPEDGVVHADDAPEIERPGAVVIVETPDDWTPASVDDVPPNVELRRCRAPQSLAAGFNEAELQNPKGYWALAVDSLPATDQEDIESSVLIES